MDKLEEADGLRKTEEEVTEPAAIVFGRCLAILVVFGRSVVLPVVFGMSSFLVSDPVCVVLIGQLSPDGCVNSILANPPNLC